MIRVLLNDIVWLKINISSTDHLSMLGAHRILWHFLCGGKKVIWSTQNQKEISAKQIFSLYSLPAVLIRMTKSNLQESSHSYINYGCKLSGQ